MRWVAVALMAGAYCWAAWSLAAPWLAHDFAIPRAIVLVGCLLLGFFLGVALLYWSSVGLRWARRKWLDASRALARDQLAEAERDLVQANTDLRRWKDLDLPRLDPVKLLGLADEEELSDLATAVGAAEATPEQIVTDLRRAGSHTVAAAARRMVGKEPFVPYTEILLDVAAELKVSVPRGESMATQEAALVQSLYARTVTSVDSAERKRFEATVQEVAEGHGKSVAGLVAVGSGLGLAQASGFGVYVMASTLVGGLAKALGIALPFAVYTGMSSAIAVLIGPIGGIILAIWGIHKLGSPSFKKTIHGVLLIARLRARVELTREREIQRLEGRIEELRREIERRRRVVLERDKARRAVENMRFSWRDLRMR